MTDTIPAAKSAESSVEDKKRELRTRVLTEVIPGIILGLAADRWWTKRRATK